MLHPVTYRALALAACGWLLACEAAAVTLGRARGAVLVGRSLELSIPVTLDAADPDGPCADGELFYGDQKLSRPPSVRWEPGANRQGALRVSSPQVVDEPMVTLYLRVGCGQSVTRRFVLLAELPPENEPAAPIVTLPARPPAAARAPQAGPAPRAANEALPRAAAAAPGPSPAPARRRREPAAAPAPAPAPAPAARPRRETAEPPLAAASPRQSRAAQRQQGAAATAERPSGRPRLQVDLLDLAPERDPTLRMSPELGPMAPADPQARQAAAALWAALRRTPEESLQEGLKLQALEQDLQSLRMVTQQNAAAVSQMRAQVEQAQGERGQASRLVFLLLAALAAVLGWALWLWRRGARRSPGRSWFEGLKPAPAGNLPPAAPLTGGVPPLTDFDPTLPPARPARADAVQPAGLPHMGRPSGNSEFQPSMGGSVRMVGVQELIDVHDKADFFLALGQHDQAVAVLEAHVHDQVETSALAWMDLLDMYHSLGKRVEYERLRSEFRQRFSVQVPDFDHFDQPSSSLENYGRALSRIVALWPSRRVLSVIEESIFRKPGLPGADPFSLEAYRELVLLYNIAREVAPPEDSLGMQLEYRPTDFPSTSLQPLSSLDTRPPPELTGPSQPSELPELLLDDVPGQATVVMGRVEQHTDRERLMIPPASPRIGLDIDLDAPSSRPAPVDLDATVGPSSRPAPDLDATNAPTPLDLGARPSAPAATEAPARPPLDFDTSALDRLLTEHPSQKPR